MRISGMGVAADTAFLKAEILRTFTGSFTIQVCSLGDDGADGLAEGFAAVEDVTTGIPGALARWPQATGPKVEGTDQLLSSGFFLLHLRADAISIVEANLGEAPRSQVRILDEGTGKVYVVEEILEPTTEQVGAPLKVRLIEDDQEA